MSLASAMPQFDVIEGRGLVAEVSMIANPPIVIVTMADLWPQFKGMFPKDARVYLVESTAREHLEHELAELAGTATFIGLGGGQAIDVAKYFAWRLNRPLFQFPTSLSVDAVFGHRAGVREKGIVKYIGFKKPEAVYIDLDVIESAPPHINRAGIGDVFCFFTGVWDWQYSLQMGKCERKWPFNEELCAVSLAKAEAALSAKEEIRAISTVGIRLMVDALRWGGASFHGAGWCPRHIEGVEHYFFYALEAFTGRKFLHGQAVCLGIVAGALMHGRRAEELRDAIGYIGVDIHPESMQITWEDVNSTLLGLKQFIGENRLAHGIATDFEMDAEFLKRLRDLVEART